MNVLLINPGLSVSERYGKALGKVGPTTEPLGLAYLASSIRKDRDDYIKILDLEAMKLDKSGLINVLEGKEWNVIGIMILTPTYLNSQDVIKTVKENSKDSKIIVGGPHVTIFPEDTLKENPEIDFGVVGEGEETIVELLSAIENDKNFDDIKGIVYRKDSEIISTKSRDFIKNIDAIPLPARDFLNMKLYKPAPTYYKRLPSHVMLTSRGCPYRCVYCSKISGNTYRYHSIERIIQEMKVLIDEYGAKEIIFRDDTFTINQEHVKKLCEEIIKQGLNEKIKWTCMTRVNLVSEDLLKLMRKAGCWSIHYGVESGSQRLLDLIQKDITIEQVKNAFKWTRDAGIEIKAFFMLGLPTETIEESLQTISLTKELDPDWIQVTITVPYPGTKLYELAKADGTLKSFKWENYQTWAGWSDKELVYTPKGRDGEELKKLQKETMKSFYLRPKFVFRQLKNLSSFNSIRTYFWGAYGLVFSGKK